MPAASQPGILLIYKKAQKLPEVALANECKVCYTIKVCQRRIVRRTTCFMNLALEVIINAKESEQQVQVGQADEPMTGAMKFFLAGCVAELYLLVIRRFYVNGTLEQVIAWDDYLKVFACVGVAFWPWGLCSPIPLEK